MKRNSTSSTVVLGISGLLLLGINVCASSAFALPASEKKSEDLVYSGSTPAAIAFAPRVETQSLAPVELAHPFAPLYACMFAPLYAVAFAPLAVIPLPPVVHYGPPPGSIILSPSEKMEGEEEVPEDVKRHFTYSFNRAFGTPTPLDPRDVEWWKGVQERRAKEKESQNQVTINVEPYAAPVRILPPPEDGGKLWDKNIPAERAKIKSLMKDYRKALGLPIDDASLEEAVSRTKMEITPVDREGNPISLSPSSSSQ